MNTCVGEGRGVAYQGQRCISFFVRTKGARSCVLYTKHDRGGFPCPWEGFPLSSGREQLHRISVTEGTPKGRHVARSASVLFGEEGRCTVVL
jgi:hypothetical protein